MQDIGFRTLIMLRFSLSLLPQTPSFIQPRFPTPTSYWTSLYMNSVFPPILGSELLTCLATVSLFLSSDTDEALFCSTTVPELPQTLFPTPTSTSS
jgi:hypothetical protein